MTANGKVVINLATGLEDPERVTVAFLVAGAAAQVGKRVTMFLSKEAVRLALPGVAQGVACDGCPTLPPLASQYTDTGGRMLVCPVCFNARKLTQEELIDGAELDGATHRWGNGSTEAPPSSATEQGVSPGTRIGRLPHGPNGVRLEVSPATTFAYTYHRIGSEGALHDPD